MALGDEFIESAFQVLHEKLERLKVQPKVKEQSVANLKTQEVVTSHLMVMFDQLSELGIAFEEVVDTMRSRIHEFDKILGIQYAENNPLNDDERALVLAPGNLRVEAIRAYRARLGCPLLYAKEAVDLYETFVNQLNNLRHERARLIGAGHLLLW